MTRARLHGRDFGTVEYIKQKTSAGTHEDFVIMPARILEEVGIEIWEDQSVKPSVLRVRVGTPKAEGDMPIRPDEIPAMFDPRAETEDVECPSCEMESIVYDEWRNRYDCRSCLCSYTLGELEGRRILNQVRERGEPPMWRQQRMNLAVTKVPTKDGEGYIMSDLRGNYIGIEVIHE